MKLRELLQGYFPIPNSLDRELSGLALDSREVKPNQLFVALNGLHVDGRKYIEDAIANGASAIILQAEENSLQEKKLANGQVIPVVSFCSLQNEISKIAAKAYQFPSHDLSVIGVTGTNGKTSCCYFIAQLMEYLMTPCAIIGTLGNGRLPHLQSTPFTTPDPILLQKTLATIRDQQIKHVAMEVSSHGLAQNRLSSVEVETAIFTNLTRDHLDYHKDMASYGQAKLKLFLYHSLKQIIINIDDPFSQTILNAINNNVNVIAYSVKKNPKTNLSLIHAREIKFHERGMDVSVDSPWGSGEFSVGLFGLPNVANLLAVISALVSSGFSFNDIISQLSKLTTVPGRMQLFNGEDKPSIIVDYSHTPDALSHALQECRKHFPEGKLYCVFGCGGDRDKGKRSQMGAIACRFADTIFITNDNPRTEDPNKIVSDILQGVNDKSNVTVECDRTKAIKAAFVDASNRDIVLIAGKGHEDYQIIGHEKHHLSDIEIAQKLIGSKTPCY